MKNAEPRLEPGDIVRLRTGERLMVVQTIGDNGVVTCIWFDESGKPRSISVPASELVAGSRPSA